MKSQAQVVSPSIVLPLNADQRLQPRDFVRELGVIGRIRHRADIFVGARSLFGHTTSRGATDENPLASEVSDDLAPFPLLERLMATHAASGAMTGGTER